jgi:hypothetical protein
MRLPVRILIAIVALLGVAAGATFAIGPWTPGMSRDRALAFADNGPYTAGPSASERDATANFQNRKTKVSLAFDERGLKTIQLRKYEGRSPDDAKAAALQLFDLFAEQFGGATVENVKPDDGKGLDRAGLAEALDKIIGTARDTAARARAKDKSLLLITFDMIPNRQPPQSRVLSQWGYSALTDSYYVYLYQDRLDTPLRRARSNLFLERIK